MAKKKPVRNKVRSAPVLARLQGGVMQMRRDAEVVLDRARKEAVRLSRDQKRALDGVVRQAQRLRSDFEKLVKRTSKDLESRPKQLLAMLEKQAEKRLEPVVKRLLAPSRQEIARLARRLHALEQLTQEDSHAEMPAASTSLFPPMPDVVVPSAGD